MAKIELTKEQQTMLAAGVVMLGAFGYGYWMFYWAPIATEIDETRTQIEAIQKDLDKAKSVAGTLESIKKDIASLEKAMIEAEKRLPRKKEVADVVDTLNDLGKKTRVNLTSIVPGPTKTQTLFIEIPYAIQLEGNYHSVARFLAAMAVSERIFNERNVNLTRAGTAGANPLEATFTLLSYQYREGGAAEDEKAKAKKEQPKK